MSWGTVIGVALLTGTPQPRAQATLATNARPGIPFGATNSAGVSAISTGVIGLVCGFILGAIVTLKVQGSFWKTQGIALAIGGFVCISAGFFAWLRGPNAPTILRETAPTLQGEQLMLVTQVRYPVGWNLDDPASPEQGSACSLQPSGPAFVLGNHVFGGKMLSEIPGSV